jgi:phage portal protein BeeE
MEGVVAGYQYIDNKITKPYATNEIIWLKFDSLDNPIVGESPITQLKYPLSNTQEAYKYRNSILAKKGALGIVSRDEKDAAGSVSWSEPDRREFEEQYFSKYGSGDNQRAFMLTKHPLKFTPTSYPTKDMLLFEEIDANLATIAMLYGASTNIFDTKTTFENLKNGIIQTYQDCIFPIADILAQGHKQGLGLPEEWELCLTYDHIELLKESKLRGAQAVNQGLAAITNALSNGLITQEQAASASDSLIATVI